MATALPVLRKYQLFKIASRLKSQGFTGSIILEEPEGKTIILFGNGEPILASSTQIALSFPAFLLRKRRLARQRLKEMLEECSQRGIGVEELLSAKGLLSPKDILRLKRELSVFVFSVAFQKDGVEYRIIPEETVSDETADGNSLELYEGLFRAVSADKDVDYFMRMFRDRWNATLNKTADFYRYLIQFRSVFYGEDITELLMEPEPTPKSVVDDAADRESAARQLYALCYSGMLTFESAGAESAGGELFTEAGAGDAEASKTVVILPQEKKGGSITSFIMGEETPFQKEEEAEPEPPASKAAPDVPQDDFEQFLQQGFYYREKEEAEPDTASAEPTPDTASAEPKPAPPPEPVEAEEEPAEGGQVTKMLDGEFAPTERMTPPEESEEEEVLEPKYEETADVEKVALGEEPEELPEDAPAHPADARLPHPDEDDEPVLTPTVIAAPDVIADDVDELLRQAVDEAEKAVAEREQEKAEELASQTSEKAVHEAGTEDSIEFSEEASEGADDLDEEVDEKVLGGLDDLGPLPELPEVGEPLASPALREPPPLPERPAVPEAGTDENMERILEDVYRSMLARNLYEILTVTPFSPLSAIRESAARLGAKYDPSQFAGYMLSSRAQELLLCVGDEIRRANEVLTDPKERAIYDNRMSTDYGQDRRVALSHLFEAETAYRAGVAAVDEENWPEALIQFTKAAETNPRDPEYLACKGWATYQALKSGQSSDSFAPNKARNIMERALAVDARHFKAMLYLARIERDMGNTEPARGWYERLHKLDPANDEVAAALDFLKMSPRLDRKPDEVGVWNRFKDIFKKK